MATLKHDFAHEAWEDWALMLAGIFTLLSPWLTNETSNSHGALNAIVVGLVVMIIAGIQLFGTTIFSDALNFLAGLWLLVSPFVLGYANTGQLRYWHFVLGAIIAIIAAFEMWQDRSSTA